MPGLLLLGQTLEAIPARGAPVSRQKTEEAKRMRSKLHMVYGVFEVDS